MLHTQVQLIDDALPQGSTENNNIRLVLYLPCMQISFEKAELIPETSRLDDGKHKNPLP
jgi:hypothetical protein